MSENSYIPPNLQEVNAYLGAEASQYFKWFAFGTLLMIVALGPWNGITWFQLGSLLLTIGAFSYGIKIENLSKLIWLLILFHLLLTPLMLLIPESIIAPDGLTYDYFGKDLIRRQSYWESLMRVYHNQIGQLDHSDFGFCFIIGSLYWIFGRDGGITVLWFLNLCCHLWTCVLIYKILTRWLEPEGALITALIFGLSSYFEFFMIAGLKENIFTLVVVGAVWWMYELIDRKTLPNFAMFAALTWCTGLFRGSFPYYFIGAIMAYFVLKNMHGFWTYVAIAGILGLTLVASSFVTFMDSSYMGQVQEGEQTFRGTNIIIKYLGPFISPFPAIKAGNQIVNTSTITFSVLNMAFAFFALLGIWKVVKLHEDRYYPVLFVFLLNAVMVMITGFAINARFLYPVQPLYYLFIPIGLYFFSNSTLRYYYMAGTFLLTYLYNFR